MASATRSCTSSSIRAGIPTLAPLASRAERLSALGHGSADPFDPYALAEEHGIAVYTLSGLREFGLGTEALSYFTVRDSSAWSAALMPLGEARVIIENESHHLVRRRSNITHELGHYLLEHPFDRL